MLRMPSLEFDPTAHRLRAAAPQGAWVQTTPRLRAGVRLRLFCAPHAGGGAALFRVWPRELPPSIEVCPLRLPGREMRLRESSITDFTVMVTALDEALSPYVDEPYALFGHSMGASLMYELAARFVATGRRAPAHLFVSGRQAPHVAGDPAQCSGNAPSDAELLRHMVAPGTGAPVALDDPELAALVLPALRADFALCRSYAPVRRPPLPVPLTVLGGAQDVGLGPAQLEPWAQHTTRAFSLRFFPGGHFFVTSAGAQVRRCVAERLATVE